MSQPDQPAAFIPPAAEGLPLGVLDSATDGASALDAWAREPVGRNFLAHALVRLARDGWLRTEPGEGFEAVRDRETPEPEDPASAVPAPADRAAAPTDWIDGHPQLEAIAAAVWEQCERSDSGLVIDDPRNIAVAALAAVLPVSDVGTEFVRQADQPDEAGLAAFEADLASETGPKADSKTATDRAALSAKLWEIAEHHIVAEWICCEPLDPKHGLCAKGYAALGMAKTLLVDSPEAWNPKAPLLDAVLAVLPAPADRAAVLREAADAVRDGDLGPRGGMSRDYENGWWNSRAAAEDRVRRMADETQQPETRPRRGDAFEAWLKAQRDEYHQTTSPQWLALDEALDAYRLHADTGTPLGEHVCEGRVVGDCECLELPAAVQQPKEARP